MGISKRELLEDYYLDEIGMIFDEYLALSNPGETVEEVYADDIW